MEADAVVSILPSDHYYSDESAFAAALDSSFDLAERYPDSVVVLGARPDRPETEYGWFELGLPAIHRSRELFRVRDFLETPSLELARGQLYRDSAWNTFVMVGRVCAFVEMILAEIPGLLGALRRARLWTGAETLIEESSYEYTAPVDFSRQVLAVERERLLVLRISDVGWSDLGHPRRVIAAIRDTGPEPWWVKEWEGTSHASTIARDMVTPIVA